jgi:hypothetical protein
MAQITDHVMIHCSLTIGDLKENGENEVLVVLNRLDITKLNEIMPIFL